MPGWDPYCYYRQWVERAKSSTITNRPELELHRLSLRKGHELTLSPSLLQPALAEPSREFLELLAFKTKLKATKGSFSKASHHQQSLVQWWEHVNMNSNIFILEKGKHINCHFLFMWKDKEDKSQCLISFTEISWKTYSESRNNTEKILELLGESVFQKNRPWRWAKWVISKGFVFPCTHLKLYILHPTSC